MTVSVTDPVQASRDVPLVVVGSASPAGGRTCDALALVRAARCPVLVVPAPDPLGRPRRDVVVGLSARPDCREADALLARTALGAAAARGTGVLAVHARQDTGPEPDRCGTAGEVDRGRLLPDEDRTVAEVLAGAAVDWPDVPLRRAVVRAPLAASLLATALSAQLLVLGVHRHGHHACSATRLLLRRLPCPVHLVPVTATPRAAARAVPRPLPDVLEAPR
jgi:nucleotide-binding universal stress UspA family protein